MKKLVIAICAGAMLAGVLATFADAGPVHCRTYRVGNTTYTDCN